MRVVDYSERANIEGSVAVNLNRTSDAKHGMLRYDIEKERKVAEETTVLMEEFTLPDGQVIKVGSERFEAPEALFTPSLIDVEK